MQLRTAHDLGRVVLDARRRFGWSQSRLAEAVGVSRQWVSLVENGKTSVEFGLVLSSLQALGYSILVEAVERHGPSAVTDRNTGRFLSHDPSVRTSLTRGGKPLGHQRSRRQRDDRDNE